MNMTDQPNQVRQNGFGLETYGVNSDWSRLQMDTNSSPNFFPTPSNVNFPYYTNTFNPFSNVNPFENVPANSAAIPTPTFSNSPAQNATFPPDPSGTLHNPTGNVQNVTLANNGTIVQNPNGMASGRMGMPNCVPTNPNTTNQPLYKPVWNDLEFRLKDNTSLINTRSSSSPFGSWMTSLQNVNLPMQQQGPIVSMMSTQTTLSSTMSLSNPLLMQSSIQAPLSSQCFGDLRAVPVLPIRCKRKTDSPPPLKNKQHITEERMAQHMSQLHISSESNVANKDGAESEESREKRLYMCEEMRKLQSDSILPESLLSRIQRPCTAVVLWTPPPRPLAPPNLELADDNNNGDVADGNSMDLDR